MVCRVWYLNFMYISVQWLGNPEIIVRLYLIVHEKGWDRGRRVITVEKGAINETCEQ